VELVESAPPLFKKGQPLLKYGSQLQRVTAYLIDHILASFVGPLTIGLLCRGLLALGLYSIAALILPGIGADSVNLRAQWESFSFLDKLRVMIVLVALPRWMYMTLFHGSRWHATPGKMILGLRVVDSSGQPIGYKTSALRSLVRGLLFIFSFGLSGLVNVFLIDRSLKKKAIHDRIVGSEVVRVSWLRNNS
jgi:uncharacterized RDD family membrane protein YckC